MLSASYLLCFVNKYPFPQEIEEEIMERYMTLA